MTTFLNALNPVTVSVTIAKQKVNPIGLILTQEYGEHHHFEITLDYDMYGDDFMSNPTKHIELIGRLVYIRFNNKISLYGEYLFKGVVTSVRQTGKEGKKGYLVISGSSPTIMLEKGKRMDIYSNRSLYQITSKIAERAYSDYIKFGSEPVFKNKIDFLMQYNESDWDFLKRLAYLYRENFFYSGHELLFGYYPDLKTVDLTYDKEILDLEFCSRMTSNNFERYQYVPETDAIIERESPENIDDSNDYLDKAEQMSHYAMTLQDKSKSYIDTPIYSNSEISEMLKRDKKRNAAESIMVKGKSKTYKTAIGQVINISMPGLLAITSNIGTYRVIKSVHRIDESGRYSCDFEAVPATIDVMPIAEPKLITADSVMAIVKSNEDPLNQGRVQVEFDFSSNYNYAWVRVLTPSAGSSEAVGQNRGMVFIPEKGDQVMVGFEHGDPNRPYVMGSLFHGKNGKGGGKNNAEKSIITKSGVQIVFNDDSRSLHIEDPSGNTWDMDGNGNIKVYAPKDIQFIASENISLKAGANFDLSVGNEALIDIMRKTFINTPFMQQLISDSYYMQSGTTLIKSNKEIKIESTNASISGLDKLFLHSDSELITNSKGNLWMQSGNTTSHNNNPESYDPLKEIIDSRTIVHFRPKDTWKGEDFGFDWMRVGDTHFLVENKGFTYDKICDETNYENLKRVYTPHIISWKNKKDESGNDVKDGDDNPIQEDYFVPWLSLYPSKVGKKEYPNFKATLDLTIEIEENHEPDSFEIKYNKDYFKIKEPNFPTTKGKHNLEIEIKCKKEFENDQQIDVITKQKDENKKTYQKLAGRLKICKNKERYKCDIVLVKVKTKDVGVSGESKGEIGSVKNGMKKYLNQALIDPIFHEKELDMTKNYKDDGTYTGNHSVFNGTFKQTLQNLDGSPINVILVTDTDDVILRRSNDIHKLHETVNSNFDDVYKDAEGNPLYNNAVKIFLINELCVLKDEANYLAGEGNTLAIPSKSVILFKDSNTGETSTHETLHALGLQHSFSPSSTYTFEYGKTDNLMDYSNQDRNPDGFIPTFHIWKWQSDIIQTDSKLTKD